MTLIFHDLKLIIEVFLDDLAAHSRQRMRHSYHLRLVFERCRHYQVRLNPHKCIFCMKVGCLLGFIISKEGIRVDPLKVEAILQLSPSCNIQQLPCLQGMENFLQRFVVNFSNLTKGFMHLLNKDTPFYQDSSYPRRVYESIPERLRQYFNCLPRLILYTFSVYKTWRTSYGDSWLIFPT